MPASPAPSADGPLGPASFCASCGAGLSSGARFCHRCGTPSGEVSPATRAGAVASGGAAAAPAAAGGLGTVLPWGVAFVALMALVAMLAGRNFGAARGSTIDGSANAVATPAIDGPGLSGGAGPFAGAPGSGAPGSGAQAPDISNMSPDERAERLFERVMIYNGRNERDSVLLFAPMALASHELLEAITLDQRYHAGLIAEAAGLPEMALAQADTVLATDPDHLLGLVLAARAARMQNASAQAAEYEARFSRVFDAQMVRALPEYDQHRAELQQAITRIRGGTP